MKSIFPIARGNIFRDDSVEGDNCESNIYREVAHFLRFLHTQPWFTQAKL